MQFSLILSAQRCQDPESNMDLACGVSLETLRSTV